MRILNKEIDGVIFDMDGTLFDTERLFIRLYGDVSESLGLPVEQELLHRCTGLNVDASRRVVRELCGEDYPYEEICLQVMERQRKIIDEEGMPIKAGVPEVLAALRNKGMPLAVATSTRRELTELYLQRASLRRFFQVVVCGDEVAKSKPEPEIFLKALELLNIEAQKCLVLEDSGNGILSASRAGILPILVKDVHVPSEEVRALAFREYESMAEFLSELETV